MKPSALWLAGLVGLILLILFRGIEEVPRSIGEFLTRPAPVWVMLGLFWAVLRIGKALDSWTTKAAATFQDHAVRLTAIDGRELGEMTDLTHREERLKVKAPSAPTAQSRQIE